MLLFLTHFWLPSSFHLTLKEIFTFTPSPSSSSYFHSRLRLLLSLTYKKAVLSCPVLCRRWWRPWRLLLTVYDYLIINCTLSLWLQHFSNNNWKQERLATCPAKAGSGLSSLPFIFCVLARRITQHKGPEHRTSASELLPCVRVAFPTLFRKVRKKDATQKRFRTNSPKSVGVFSSSLNCKFFLLFFCFKTFETTFFT